MSAVKGWALWTECAWVTYILIRHRQFFLLSSQRLVEMNTAIINYSFEVLALFFGTMIDGTRPKVTTNNMIIMAEPASRESY